MCLGHGSLLLRTGGASTAPPLSKFDFEEVFHPGASQEVLFDGVRPMLDAALTGTNVTIFAYGQTGEWKCGCGWGGEGHPWGIDMGVGRGLK